MKKACGDSRRHSQSCHRPRPRRVRAEALDESEPRHAFRTRRVTGHESRPAVSRGRRRLRRVTVCSGDGRRADPSGRRRSPRAAAKIEWSAVDRCGPSSSVSLEVRGLPEPPASPRAGRVRRPTPGYRFYVEASCSRSGDRCPALSPASELMRLSRACAARSTRRSARRPGPGAVADHRPRGARQRAAAAHGDDPPRRGAASSAADGDGGRDRLQRRRHQARLHLRPRRSIPAWSSGRAAT